MTLFRGKYRVESNRWSSWDYSGTGGYFFTIITKGRRPYFGRLEGGKVQLSEVGKIAWDEWKKSPGIRADMNLTLGEFVVIPDHVHGIFVIGNSQFNGKQVRCRDGNSALNSFSPQRKNLASVIRGYKSALTTWARKHQIEFGWQPGYHDRVIRTDQEFRRIRQYIINNPERWHKHPTLSRPNTPPTRYRRIFAE